jgi:hypothetical protein
MLLTELACGRCNPKPQRRLVEPSALHAAARPPARVAKGDRGADGAATARTKAAPSHCEEARMTDDQSLLALKLLKNLLLAVGGLPTPRIENLAEWDRVAPPITQAAEAISMALRERNPTVASTLLEVAAKCAAMRAAVKDDEGNSPAPDRIRHRERQISENPALDRSVWGSPGRPSGRRFALAREWSAPWPIRPGARPY